ncbi:hypothetical protein K435DRAFT_728343 [Dendrothele bispora CBS 962.96]|uniref:Uncharacterized protein n=1 Tax=Dendrothele bispora (strain CBS 962.96) TaxID=1314807 RepID=A0A4S8LMA6_DENBC|nr:hypothetical protein K435DRAFT_728343 [Dendrothele bispora CBS 962.96]
MFAGRNQGGGTRNEVYGTRSYGSGYPGVSGLGVSNRGFPFYFWPVTWGAASGYTATHYYHDADSEYGLPGNSSRPGGVISFATFSSNTQNTTFHVVSDNATVTNLITDIYFHCSSSINNSTSTTTPVPFNDSDPSAPSPQSVIQYYRASSVALTLDGYNNSATWANATDSTPDTPLPTNIDTTLQNCLNQTIGQTALLMDSVSDNGAVPALSVDAHFLALFLVCLHLVKTLF